MDLLVLPVLLGRKVLMVLQVLQVLPVLPVKLDL